MTFSAVPHINPDTVLWIYIVLLIIGGLVGYFKAGSQVSLIMSASFAAVLALCVTKFINPKFPVVDILLAALLVVFAVRLGKTKTFMPAGLMLVLTIATLALRHI